MATTWSSIPHALVLRFPSSVLGERPGHVGASQSGDKRPLLERALLHIEQLRGRFLQSGLFLHPDRWSNEELRGIGCQTGCFLESIPPNRRPAQVFWGNVASFTNPETGSARFVAKPQPGALPAAKPGKEAESNLANSKGRPPTDTWPNHSPPAALPGWLTSGTWVRGRIPDWPSCGGSRCCRGY